MPSLRIRRKSTYEAQGAIERPDAFENEIGSSRNMHIRETVPTFLSRRHELTTFNLMARTDATCSVSLRVQKAPIVGAEFYFEPANSDEASIDQAQFIEDNITRLTSTPWMPTISKICRFAQDGNSIFEPCYTLGDWRPNRPGANSKTYTLMTKFAYRPALTIKEIRVDDHGGPYEIVQNAIDRKGKTNEVVIPIEKAAIFVLGDCDDYYGESVLRAAHEHWFYKKHLYKIDAIQKERHSLGVPRGQLPPGAKDSDRKLLRKLLANIRANEEAFIIQPPGWIIDFAKIEGNLVNALESASMHDTLILLNVMAQFMILGLESSGSGGGRSTSAASLDIFYKSLWHIANLICDVFNTYVIPRLMQYNFDTDQFPKMKVRAIGQSRDLQQISTALANVFKNQIITPDISTENWTRTLFDMPKKEGNRQTPIKAATQTPVGSKNGNGNGPTNGQGNMGADTKSA